MLCVGSDHAIGTQREALGVLHSLVRPGGRLLFGSGFWERPPTDVSRQADQHRDGWLGGYRGLLGFAYLVLAVPLSMPGPDETRVVS